MRIDLNARIRTKDGHEAGKIHRVLIDPETERITGFVVSTGRLLGRDVIVGEDMFADASPGGETITLTLNKKELDIQPSFEEDDFVRITEDEVRLGVDREEIIPREHETRTP